MTDTMKVDEVFHALDNLKQDEWETPLPVQQLLDGRVKISEDHCWRRVQLISLLLEELIQCESSTESCETFLSVSRRKTLSQTFDFLIGYSIRPNLIATISRSTHQKSPSLDTRECLVQHRRLVASVCLMLQFSSTHLLGPFLYEKHLSDLLIAMYQLCHAPILKIENIQYDKKPQHGSEPSLIDCLVHGLEIQPNTEDITKEQIISEMHSDRVNLLPKLENLLQKLFQPALIKSLIEILSAKNPSWLRKACAIQLSRCLIIKNGFAHFLIAVGDSFRSDIAEWKQVETFASLIARPPSFIDAKSYTANIGLQLKSILFVPKDAVQFRLIVAVLNAFLSKGTTVEVEHILLPCFGTYIDVLRGRTGLSAPDFNTHLTFVSSALEILPQNTALLEVFALFMPLYMKAAVHGHCSVSLTTKKVTDVMGKLMDKIEEGPQIFMAILDPDEKRFKVADNVRTAFGDDGGIEFTVVAGDEPLNRNEKSVDDYVNFIVSFGKSRPEILSKLFLVLLRKFEEIKSQDDSTQESVFFKLLVAALIATINPLVENSIQGNIELMIEFALANLQRYLGTDSVDCEDDTLPLILGMLESIASNCDQLSSVGLQRLKLASELLKHVEGTSGTLERCANLSKLIAGMDIMENVKCFIEPVAFAEWKFVPVVMKSVLNVEWKPKDSLKLDEEQDIWKEPTIEELLKNRIKINRKCINASIYGKLGEYKEIKMQLQNPSVAIRGHGFIQLRKLLCARDPETMKDLDEIVQLCEASLGTDDSYVYLGAVQCMSEIVTLETRQYLNTLLSCLSSSNTQDDRVRVLLAECLARTVPNLGDRISIYSTQLVPVLTTLCNDPLDLIRVYGCSLLGEAVPGLYNVDRDFHEFLNIIITLMTSDESVIVRRAAAQGTARLIEKMNKTSLVNRHPHDVRDLHRVVKRLYVNAEDEDPMKVHLQKILLRLGEIAKSLIQDQDNAFNIKTHKVNL